MGQHHIPQNCYILEIYINLVGFEFFMAVTYIHHTAIFDAV
jgi:hypothetical protein